jgi:HEPN domain
MEGVTSPGTINRSKKTHDLAALGSQCKGIDDSLSPLLDRLDDLSPYAWAFRYPTSFTEPPSADVDEASALAQLILA